MCGKNSQFEGAYIPRKYIEFKRSYSCHPFFPHSKLCLKFLSAHNRQRKTTYAPGSIFFENQFPPTAERGENYDLLYQNSLRKYDVFLMVYDGKCDGFTVL